MKPERIVGPKRFFKQRQVFDYVAIEHNGAAIAHVFVAPQELKGLMIGYITPHIDGATTTIGGDLEIGNANDGSFLMDFELTYTNGVAGPLLLGNRQYDLKKGRAFVVTAGYKISQMKSQTKDDAIKNLPGA